MDTVFYNKKPYGQVKFNLFVNNYGIGAVKWAENRQYPWAKKQLQYIKWQARKTDGRRYIVYDHQHLLLDELIGQAFGDKNGFRADDGRSWEITYADGNVNHCCQTNLEWKLKPHYVDSQTGLRKIDVVVDDTEITVCENGDVFMEKRICVPIIDLVDADTELHWATEPSISAGSGLCPNRRSIDSLMVRGNFIDGDPSSFAEPVILHRDMNYKNHEASNLEWCDKSDSRYVEYRKKKRREQDLLEASLNPERRLFRTLKPIDE